MIADNLHEICRDDPRLRTELKTLPMMDDVETATRTNAPLLPLEPHALPPRGLSWAGNNSSSWMDGGHSATSGCETSRKPKISQRLTHFVDFFERHSSSGVLESFDEEQPHIVVSRSRRKAPRTDRYPTCEHPGHFSPTNAESMTHKKSHKRNSVDKPSVPASTAPPQKGSKVLQIIRRYFNNHNSSDAEEAASLSPSSSSVISNCRRPWDSQKNRGERSMTISSGTTGGSSGKTQWVEVEKKTPYTVGRSISKVWKKQVVNLVADDLAGETDAASSEKAEQRQHESAGFSVSREPEWRVTDAGEGAKFSSSPLMRDMIEARPTVLVGADCGPVSKIVNDDWKKRDELASQLASPPLASPWLPKSGIERQERLLMGDHMNGEGDATGLSGPGSSSGSNFIWDQFRVSQSSSSLLEHQAQLSGQEDSFSLGLPFRRHSSDFNSNEKEGRVLLSKEKIKSTGAAHPKFIFSMDSEPLVARDDMAQLCGLRSADLSGRAQTQEVEPEERAVTPEIVRKVSEPFSYRARTFGEPGRVAPRSQRPDSSEGDDEPGLSADRSPPENPPTTPFFEEPASQEHPFAPSEPAFPPSHGPAPSPDSKVKKASHFVAIRIEDADVIEKTRIFQELLISAYPLLEECRAKPHKLHLTLLVLSLAPEDVPLATEALQIGMKRFMKTRGDLVEANQNRLLAEGKIGGGMVAEDVAPSGQVRIANGNPTRSFNQAPSPDAFPAAKSRGGFTLEFRTIGTFGLDLLFLAPSVGQSIILKCLHVELAKAFSESGLVIVGAGSGWNSAMEIHQQLLGKGFMDDQDHLARVGHSTPVLLATTGQKAAWTSERQEEAAAEPLEETTGEDTPPMWTHAGAKFYARAMDRSRRHKNGFVWQHQKKLSLLDEALLKMYDHSANKSTTFVPQITLFKVSRANKKAKKRKGVHLKDGSPPACDAASLYNSPVVGSPALTNGRRSAGRKVLKLIPRMYHPLVQRTLICGLDESTIFSPHSYLEFLPPPPPPQQFAGLLSPSAAATTPSKMNDGLASPYDQMELQAVPTPSSEFLMVPLDQVVTTSRLHHSPFGMQTCLRVDLLEMSQLDPDDYYKRVCSVVLDEDASTLFN